MSVFDQRGQNVNSQINISIDLSSKSSVDDLANLMKQLKQQAPDMPLPIESKAELQAEIATVESQLSSPNPKPTIIQESMKTIRSILEGMAGNAAYAGLLLLLSKVTSG